jgi:hypothetical protein
MRRMVDAAVEAAVKAEREQMMPIFTQQLKGIVLDKQSQFPRIELCKALRNLRKDMANEVDVDDIQLKIRWRHNLQFAQCHFTIFAPYYVISPFSGFPE